MPLFDEKFFRWKKLFVRSMHLFMVLFMTASMFLKDTDLKEALRRRDYAYFIPYVFMVYLSLLFYFLTCLTSPGYVKRKIDPDQSIEDLEEHLDKYRCGSPNQPFEPEAAIKLRFCDTCKIQQPIRSRHCEECGRVIMPKCIRKFDHHCPWLETCIGERNHGYFWAFLFVTNILILWTIVLICKAFAGSPTWTLWLYYNFYLLSCLIVLIISFLVCISLFGIHTYFMLNNTTTWERFSRKNITYLKIINDEKLNPFYENCCRNIAHFFQCTFCTHVGDTSAGETSEDETRWERIYLKYLKKKKVINKDIIRTEMVPASPPDPTVSTVPVAEPEIEKPTSVIQMDRLEQADEEVADEATSESQRQQY